MAKHQQVLIIDDNEVRRNKLQVILDFLGEPSTVVTSQSWPESVLLSPNDLLTIIIGELATAKSDKAFIKEVYQWAPEIPLLLLDRSADVFASLTELSGAVISALDYPLTYSQLLNVIHRCQAVHEDKQLFGDDGVNRRINLFRSLVGTSQS